MLGSIYSHLHSPKAKTIHHVIFCRVSFTLELSAIMRNNAYSLCFRILMFNSNYLSKKRKKIQRGILDQFTFTFNHFRYREAKYTVYALLILTFKKAKKDIPCSLHSILIHIRMIFDTDNGSIVCRLHLFSLLIRIIFLKRDLRHTMICSMSSHLHSNDLR